MPSLVSVILVISCAAESNWTNVTVWHVHPQSNLEGDLRNMDSGDVFGDMFFASRDRWLPLACKSSKPPGECHMTEVSDPSVLAVSQVLVEMDMAHIGVFKACNLVDFTPVKTILVQHALSTIVMLRLIHIQDL